jgi:SAM-dependent methyltransferase
VNAAYLPIFAAAQSASRLEFVGRREGDELLDGPLLCDGREVGQITDGVACFCDDNWPAEELERIMTDDWLARKWRDKVAHSDPTEATFCDEIAAEEGVVLEVAAGPGGGNLQGILSRNPEARLIVNDTSRGLLRYWRQFILGRGLAQHTCFSAFDARRMVLRDESISVVSGVSAFDNIGGLKVFEETSRVLQPGGAVYSCDMVVDPDDWRRLPEAFREEEQERAPGFVAGISGLLTRLGFAVERHEYAPGRALDPEEDGIQRRADEHGVTLHVGFEYVKAKKPI